MSVAAIDIGTNSIRLLVADAQGRELDRRMRITRLGQGVDATGVLAEQAISRTLSVLETYSDAFAQHQVSKVRVAATSAARDATNREEFFSQVERSVGVLPELLSGEEEAALTFAGATRDFSAWLTDEAELSSPLEQTSAGRTAGARTGTGDKKTGAKNGSSFLVVDIGGGSTEFVLGRNMPESLVSIDMGCVRMTERHFRSDPSTPEERARAIADIDALLGTVPPVVPVRTTAVLIGVAGTVTSVAAVALGLNAHDASRTHGLILSQTQVAEIVDKLAGAMPQERRGMLIEPMRADVIVAGGLVLLRIMEKFDFDRLLVSEKDILDGLAASLCVEEGETKKDFREVHTESDGL